MSKNYISFIVGKKIRKLRLQNNVNQRKLGVACGITFQQIQKYETGTNRISIDRLYDIANFFNVDISELLTDIKTKDE